jgi:hypothetical protein
MIISELKQASKMLSLASELSALDAGGEKGVADFKEYLVLAGKLQEQVHALGKTVAEIEGLFGADMDELKKKFGI